jgi:hypothetical protein
LAFYLWQIGSAIALGVFVKLWPTHDRIYAILLTPWFGPLWFVFGLAQDTTFLLACISLAGWLLHRRQPVLAGVVLAVCGFKGNVLLALPVLLLARRMWKVCAGAALGGMILYFISAIPSGLGWPLEYVAALRRTSELHPVAPYFPTLAGLVDSLPHTIQWIRWPLVLLALGLLFAVCRRLSDERALGLAFLTGVLISPFSYVYDVSVMLPGVIDATAKRGAAAGVLAVILGMGVLAPEVITEPWVAHCSVILIFAGAIWAAFQDGRA